MKILKFLRFPLIPLAFLIVGFVRLISPWKVIRFGAMWSGRVGHLMANTECYLCEKDAGLHNGFLDIWFPTGGICNYSIYRKYKKLLHVWPSWFVVVVKVNMIFKGWRKHIVSDLQFGRDIYNLYHGAHIGFTKEEEEKGKELLQDLGIPEGAKWVCLIVRDAAYLKELTYHDYRNSDIDDYKDACIMLAGRGYYVVRMGAAVEKPFNSGLKFKIIDYASGKRTEFGDLYLGAKCSFCVSTGTGFDDIPRAFLKPIAYVNFAPLEYAPTYVKGLMIWKHHIKDGKRMSVEEICSCGAGQFTFGPLFKDAGITLEDNSSLELCDVVMEMADHLESGFPDLLETNQTIFWQKFPRSISPYNGRPLQGEIKLRIGKKFLESYSEKT